MESYAFVDGEDLGIPPPPLYEELRGTGFWVPWVLLSAPVWVLGAAVCSPLGDLCGALSPLLPSLGPVRFPLASVLYSYALAAWAVHSASEFSPPRGFWSIAGLASALAAALVSGLPAVPAYPEILPMAASGWASATVVFATYCVAGYGLWEALLRGRRG